MLNTDRDRSIIQMKLDGMTMREISKDLNCSRSVVSGALYRARRRGDDIPFENHPTTTMERLARYHLSGCSWVIGDPGTPDWRWCGAPIEEESPYCPTHRAKTR
jgi:hypothetical protein